MLPASAGMILIHARGLAQTQRAPRIRGDDPCTRIMLFKQTLVLPASAGVILSLMHFRPQRLNAPCFHGNELYRLQNALHLSAIA